MNICDVQVTVLVRGLGVTPTECGASLGFAAEFLFSKPGRPEFHSWGWNVTAKTDYVADVVVEALRRLEGRSREWLALLDRHPEWQSECVCTIRIPHDVRQQDDFPTIEIDSKCIGRLRDLRLGLLVAFTSKDLD